MTTTKKRIYAVKSKATGITRLVMTTNGAQAMRHVANDTYEVRPANAVEVARHMADGVKLEDPSIKVE